MRKMRRNRKKPKGSAAERTARAWGFHIPTRIRGVLPEAPPIPRIVRVLKNGVVIDEWLIGFPLTGEQATWLIDMSYRWLLLDDSTLNRKWLIEILDTIEAAFRRFAGE